MMTDPVADMLTRIRNANRIERPVTDMPATKLKAAIAQVLKDEGFILDYQTGMVGKDEAGHPTWTPEQNLGTPKVVLRVYLKYGPEGERVIRHIQRASRPGRRLYRRRTALRPVLGDGPFRYCAGAVARSVGDSYEKYVSLSRLTRAPDDRASAARIDVRWDATYRDSGM